MTSSSPASQDDLLASGRSSTSRLNDLTGRAVLLVLALAPVPLGSNRPFFWSLWALVLGLLLIAYGAALYRKGLRLRLPFTAFQGLTFLFTLVSFWMALQVLPIGKILPLPDIRSTTGTSFAFSSISLTPGDTLLALLRWLSYGVLFFLALQASVRKQRARRLTWFLLLFVAIQAAYAIIAMLYLADQVVLVEKTQYLGEATGTFVNRNSLATYLGFGCVLALLLALPEVDGPQDAPRKRSRRGGFSLALTSDNILAGVALLIMLAALLATGSRMGLFATFCGLATALLARLPGWRSRLTGLGVIAVAGVGFVAIYGAGTLERLITVERDSESRLSLYRDTLAMISDRPLLGFGAQSFEYAFPLYDTDPGNSAYTYDKAHSTYLTHWSELGLVFGSLPLILVLVIAVTLLRALWVYGLREVEICAALAVIAVAAVHSLVDFSLEIEAVTFLFVTILAIGFATAYEGIQKQGRRSSGSSNGQATK
ncbi:O-antigen ligase family protein [Pannonibacter carbonis]|uniref:O-antigen ligase family protein n=1 Tax=Pannonibacter carbonis TaxID=2067569 RepID=UPI0013005827|nr:O-antigen ligase family protein [Pannonibacter carbonis]